MGAARSAPKVNGWCTDGLHLWCPNKSGRYGRFPCTCPCHQGRVVRTSGTPKGARR